MEILYSIATVLFLIIIGAMLGVVLCVSFYTHKVKRFMEGVLYSHLIYPEQKREIHRLFEIAFSTPKIIPVEKTCKK